MNSKQASTRPVGQRSIPSTFLFRSSNGSGDCNKSVDVKVNSEKSSKISFSEFLNRKLNRGSMLQRSVLGKERPPSSTVGCEVVSSSSQVQTLVKKRDEVDKDLSLDIVLQQFKDCERKKNYINDSASGSDELCRGKPESRKRIRVIGDDSGQRIKKRPPHALKEEPKVLFNHYANGGGWWDYDMEGVDNEEVGNSDVWEGMGSTTLGGLDWH